MSKDIAERHPREEELTLRGLLMFSQANIGDRLKLPITAVNPSQPDDGQKSKSKGPIFAADVDGKPLVVDGNHRLYRRFDLYSRQPSSIPAIEVYKVKNPYKP